MNAFKRNFVIILTFVLLMNSTVLCVSSQTYEEWLAGTANIEKKNVTAYYMEPDFSWPVPEETTLANGTTKEGMRFRPYDKAVTLQNPPDFSWPAMVEYSNVKYHLIISDKEDMSNIVYEKKDLEMNIYNFPHTFDKKTYYWQVSWTCDEGKSEWSDVRRFTISDDATEFTVPDDFTEILNRISNMEHPRLFDVEEIKKAAKYRDADYDTIRKNIKAAMKNFIPL